MFKLEEAIKEWRSKTRSQARLEDGVIEELESHLRDLVSALVVDGVDEERAFKTAVREVGVANELGTEFRLARERKPVQVARKFLPGLLVNYMIVMMRQFRRYSLHSWLTVIGLAIGLTSCLFITFYVLHELSFDKQYAGKNIYRVINRSLSDHGIEEADAGGPVPMGPALKDEFPEVLNAVRFWRAYRPVVNHADQRFEETRFFFADPNALDVFGFTMVVSQSKEPIGAPNTVIISQSTATKYFGDDDPLGKTLEYNGYPQGKLSFTVTGVFVDLPDNTHFDFDFLASFQSLSDEIDNWGSFKPLWTYVELVDSKSVAGLQMKLEKFADQYMADRRQNRQAFELHLEPVESIHLESNADRPMKPGGNMAMIRVAVLTGALILIMSCVNFINISLARITVRMKEVGMRKVLGAVRWQLMFQFIMEVISMFAIALLLAVTLMFLLAPAFAEITGVRPSLDGLLSPQYLLILLMIFVFVVLLSGYAPSSRLAGFSVVNAFRQTTSMSNSRGMLNFRNVLIFIQLAISGMLIMSVMVVHDQLQYITSKDLGLKADHVVAIPYSANPEVFENMLRSMPAVQSFGYSQRLPVNTINYDGRVVKVPGIENNIEVESCFITADFLNTYNIRLIAGRNILPNHPADSNKFVINKTAVKAFGWTMENAVGGELTWSGDTMGEVIGVVEDFHLESVHETIPPMVMLNGDGLSRYYRTFISIRIDPAHAGEVEKLIEQQWRELNPEKVFMLIRMNESFNQLHASDQIFSRIVFYFMMIAIFISAIGLYAVSSYAAEQKRKEMGIRKVLGSGTGSIVYKLAAPYVFITIASFVVAVPVVYTAMNQWLATFAYHVSVSWLTLGLAAALMLVLAILSVLKESLRAAVVNPVKFLRDE